MKGFVFTFDIIVGLFSMVYLLLFVFSTPSPILGVISDLSVFRRVYDYLLVENSLQSINEPNFTVFSGENACFPLVEYCDISKDWICSEWRKSELFGEKIGFNPIILCLEGLN